MCYTVQISTDSPEDLTSRSSPLVRFEPSDSGNSDDTTTLLEFPHRWYVGSKSHCGCTFRHLHSIELGFGEPEDWCPEEQDEIAATRALYAVLLDLVSSGYRVDLLDTWSGVNPNDILTLDVALADMSPSAFRLFENHRFRLCATTVPPPHAA